MCYVLHYYREGRIDTQKALNKIQARVGIRPRTAKRLYLRWASVAASALILLGIGTYLYLRPTATTLTADASQQVYRLPDGTIVTLAPHATLSYKGDCREVEMTGKAYFTIHHDASHPFTIADNDYIVRDIGTHLQVEESAAGTRLTVLEGAASFGSTRSGSTAVALRAGMSAMLTDGESSPRLDRKADPNSAAWATHEFHFIDTPLADVLHTLSTYYHVRLTADNMSKRLTADFDTANLNSIITVIEQTLDVKIEERKE
uniref:FecR family protein n=1 Tax=Prevotella sp. TaxID=59823 RepID=UPI0040297662